MRLYNLIQEKIFHTYAEWRLKSSLSNSTGFHIVGIENHLKAMRDGYLMYVELYPPHAIKGCTAMKAVCGKQNDRVDLYLEICGNRYVRAGVPYEETAQIMKDFVQKSVRPDERDYAEAHADDAEKIEAFRALSVLLIGDAAHTQHFLKRAAPKRAEEIEDAWEALYEELLMRGRALELDWKSDRETFLDAVQKLTAGMEFPLDETMLDESESIPVWSGVLNASWSTHVLAAMDMNSDSYVLLVLTKEDFARAAELAKTLLHRIAPTEEM